ncbi:MAG: roadblock/LC7 domain-containing protein [Verrucomicrobiae bacterium]|nr:roadblock/LC7 domain-containing protein [Verrucomicrobiae bacterium]MCX7722591.1 roadblock/LC7 domain-containing protein [Verrucomicrobiae bacterium]MDW7981122.1 roadblock/LC7 domain-containing protein [Verrucomicrobiales bacterium]
MGTLPQLLEEDIAQIEDALRELLSKTDATTAVVIDKAGFLIAKCGNQRQFDLTSIAALAAGAYAATQTIANLVREKTFNSIYHQGERYSVLITNVDEHCLLVTIFRAVVGVGAVKYFAGPACERIAKQMKLARQRQPDASIDLSQLNLADTSQVFKRKR